jgi:iron-sulfur cluster assembly protein
VPAVHGPGHRVTKKLNQEVSTMVTLTDHAATAIRNLTAQPGAAERPGLRIATDASRGSLTLSLAVTPAQGDAVVESDGATLYLDPGAATALDGKALDASTDAEGQVRFTVAEQ